MNTRERLAEALRAHRPRSAVLGNVECACGWFGSPFWQHQADTLPPVVEAIAAERAAEAIRPFEELFSGGPDTACRTTWRTEFGHSIPRTECVEVPMAELRDAFGRASALTEETR